MQIEMIKLQELIPYENNPRDNDKSVPKVKESIQQFGFKVPIIIDRNKIIVCGHTRYKAAKELGLEEVPCIMADDLNEEQIQAFRLADNKVGEDSTWIFEKLEMELQGITSLDMSMFGFAGPEEVEPEVLEDGYDEELPEEPKSKLGQIYQLGQHRLMCGDSTSKDDVSKLMAGEMADLVLTDPPYNINVHNSKGMTIKNDNMGSSEFREFLTKAFGNLNAFLKSGGVFYVWLAAIEWTNFEAALNANNLYVKQELIWNKNQFTLGWQDYQWKHEPCMYGWKEGSAHYFINDRSQATVFEDLKKIDFRKLKKEELINILADLMKDTDATTVIDEHKPSHNDLHPTMKPLKLMGKLISNSSKRNENVLDLFGGSGSTLIACEQLNRKCYMMEYDPKYMDAIIDRWETFTGKKAKLLN